MQSSLAPKSATQASPERLPGIRHVIAVASGKGGVGKSTVAVNLALALQRSGARVGIVDADVLGPSVPGMLGADYGQAPPQVDGRFIPVERHGVKLMSMGLITGHDKPAILRAPMVNKYIRSFVSDVAWGALDHLIIDLPPGTGDVQITLSQRIPLDGVLVVTTPQQVSLDIARRGLRMFQRVRVPVLGVVENMSGFVCGHCQEKTEIFRAHGGARMAEETDVPFLGAIPLDPRIVLGGDTGVPAAVESPDGPVADAFGGLATRLQERLGNPSEVPAFSWDWSSGEGAPEWPALSAPVDAPSDVPAGLRQRDSRTLSILWRDGEQTHVDVRDLRLSCPCALCVDENTGQRILRPERVPTDVAPRSLASVGNYAFSVAWSDGHHTGIHSYESLRHFEAPRFAAAAPAPGLDDGQLSQRVAALLESEINPSVGRHGGRIALERVQDGDVYLHMEGGCQGCAAASVTLRQGIEVRLRRALPQVRDIIDLTDHASGTAPYQAPVGAPQSPLKAEG